MSGDHNIHTMQVMFTPWRNAAANLPPVSTLAHRLEAIVRSHHQATKSFEVIVTPNDAKLFASASIDIWQRAVHSLLISTALTRESILWSCVSGYYATHYTFRALAHLMGHYQLFQLKWMVTVRLEGGQFVASFRKGREREHDWYRKLIAQLPCLNQDPFFLTPKAADMIDASHRDRANYADHLAFVPTIQDFDRGMIRSRMQQLAGMEVLTPSGFALDTFPDVNAVQINAYQRVVRFRRFLDESLDRNRLWSVFRNPGWAAEYTDFQFVEPRGAVQR